MIVTLTANPSIDRTLEITGLDRGSVVRATATRVHPGGKGVNVARALIANGVAARAVLPVGGHEGRQLLDLLSSQGIEVVPVPIAEPVRENVTVVEPDGTVTKLNAPGPSLSPGEAAALVRATLAAAGDAEWVALCGTLPPGVPEDLYAGLVSQLRGAGIRVAVDSSGAEFGASIDAGPEVIKPNAEELSEVVGRPVRDARDVVDAARELLDRGVERVLVSLGKDGAVAVWEDGAVHGWTAPLVPRSTVGAGDAALAGFLASDGDGVSALRAAVAWGAAAVRLPGTAMPTPGEIDVDEVRVEELDAGLDAGRRIG